MAINSLRPWYRRAAAARLSAVAMAALLSLTAMAAQAGDLARHTADALMLAHATSILPREPEAIGIDAAALDSRVLSKQHGKNTPRAAASGTNGVAVILWDERGSQGGQTTRVSMTGMGNVQSSTVSLSLR